MAIESREQEILRIEHELEILRSRYAWMKRLAQVLKVFLTVALPGLSLTVLALLAIKRASLHDTFGQGPMFWFSVCCFAVILGAAIWLLLAPGQQKYFRWIDVAKTTPSDLFYPSNMKSGAEMVEAQIATREKRLAELRNRRL